MFLVLLELSLQGYSRLTAGRFLFERMVIPIYAADADRCYKLKAGLAYRHRTNEYQVTYHANEQGLRTDSHRRELPAQKRENGVRILFLGPSFTFGWGNDYEDAYPTLSGSLLQEDGIDAEVVNLGTPGQPVSYKFCWLENQGKLFQPDVIVQTVYGSVANLASRCWRPDTCPTLKNGYLHRAEIVAK